MSHTGESRREQKENYKSAHDHLSDMMRQGRSFSGHERNCCFLNLGKEYFATASAISGLDFPDDGRGISLVDWDQDGDLDLWMINRTSPRIRFFRNEIRTANHFLSIRLEGDGLTSNRDAIGARVELFSEDMSDPALPIPIPRSVKSLRSGEGFLAQSSKWLHFGLGDKNRISQLVVRWPGGKMESFDFTGLAVDRPYRLVQGSGLVHSRGTEPRKVSLTPTVQPKQQFSNAARIPLVTLVPGPRLDVHSSDGARVTVGNGEPVLVTLWASWCPSCVQELKELGRRQSEIRQVGLKIIALSVDGLGEDQSEQENADALLSQIAFPFPRHHATRKVIERFQEYHDSVIQTHRSLPVPTSFLYDPRGRISVIYKGPLSIDDLLADVEHAQRTRRERHKHAALFPGRTINDLRASLPVDLTDARYHLNYGQRFDRTGSLEAAEKQFREALSIIPDYAYAHYHLGIALQRQGKEREALRSFREAVRIKPDHAKAHLNLGVSLYRTGNVSDARQHFEQAIRSDPLFFEAHFNLGSLLLSEDDTAGAFIHFKDAIRIRPDFAQGHQQLGGLYEREGNERKALQHYQEAKRIRPDLPSLDEAIKKIKDNPF